MGLFVDRKKLKAALHSMHQFLGPVRSIFPCRVPDDVAEAALAYMYFTTASSVFDRRFTSRLELAMREKYQFATAVEIESRVNRIRHLAEAYRQAYEDARSETSISQTPFQDLVRGAIKALFVEAGREADEEIVTQYFALFEEAARRLRDHLAGIRKQNHFLMR